MTSLGEARGLLIRTEDEVTALKPPLTSVTMMGQIAGGGLSSLLQRSNTTKQASAAAAARKRNVKISLKCESLEVDTAHIRELRSTSHLMKTKSFTYGLTSAGSDSDISQNSQHSAVQAFASMNSMRATLNVQFANSPFILTTISQSMRDSFDSRNLSRNVPDIGDSQLSKLFKACTQQYLDALQAFIRSEKQEYTLNDTIDSADSGRSSRYSGASGLGLTPAVGAVSSMVLSVDDYPPPSSRALSVMSEVEATAMQRYIDVLITFSEVLQLENRLPDATMLILAGLVYVHHIIRPYHTTQEARLTLLQQSSSGTQLSISKDQASATDPSSSSATSSSSTAGTGNGGLVFDEMLLNEVDTLLNRLLSPQQQQDPLLSSGSSSTRSTASTSMQAIIYHGMEVVPGTDLPLFVSMADGRTVEKQCSLLAACQIYRDTEAMHNLYIVTLLVKRFGVLLRAQGALAEAMICLQAATHVFKVLSEVCEEYLEELAGSYALMAATLVEMGSEEESTRTDDEARRMDLKALELAVILAST